MDTDDNTLDPNSDCNVTSGLLIFHQGANELLDTNWAAASTIDPTSASSSGASQRKHCPQLMRTIETFSQGLASNMELKIADTVSSNLEDTSHQETLGKPTLDEKDFETTHARIHVYDSRPASDDTGKPIVLFLHGNSFCSKIWLPFFESDFAYAHRLIALDYPGHGESGDALDPERSYNMPGYADAALQILRQIDASRYKLMLRGDLIALCPADRHSVGRSSLSDGVWAGMSQSR